MDWIWAGVAIVGGFALASISGRIVRQTLERRKGRLQQIAPAVSSAVFSAIVVVALLVALSFVQPDSVKKLRDDTIDYLPRAISALIVVIAGSVLGTIVSAVIRESIGRTMGRLGEQIPTVVKGVVTAFAAILAASQLGIDTTVINIVVAALVFGLALAFALVVGFGSRPVATEIASGRALRRLVRPGDAVRSESIAGTVVALHPTAVEVEIDGHNTLVPNTQLGDAPFRVDRPDPED